MGVVVAAPGVGVAVRPPGVAVAAGVAAGDALRPTPGGARAG
jgi:hypothetical protein